MLLLSDASLIFLKFLQIFLWISIPAFLIGLLITTVIHYNNKRKKQKGDEQAFIFGDDDDGLDGDRDEDSLMPLHLQGNDLETKKVRKYLSFSKARYIAIQKDFKVLSEKYHQLKGNINKNSETKNKETMESIQTGMQQTSFDQIDDLKQQYAIERKELIAELDQLTTSFENLEKDNISLRDQLNVYCESGTGFTSMIQKWEEEKTELKRRINDQEYLRDVLEEKKQQIVFLQQQLEQRIKNHHLVEQQFRELGIKFMEANEKLEIKEQSDKEFLVAVHDKEQEITFLKEVLQSATENASQFEITIKDLQAQLAEANEGKMKLEEKLERSQTFFKGFHRKLSDMLQEEIPESPVIVMKPVYKQENIEGQITESAIQ